MPSKARQKKIMEKLNRAQKCSILGPQNLGSRGGRGTQGPPRSAPVLYVLTVLSTKLLIGDYINRAFQQMMYQWLDGKQFWVHYVMVNELKIGDYVTE